MTRVNQRNLLPPGGGVAPDTVSLWAPWAPLRTGAMLRRTAAVRAPTTRAAPVRMRVLRQVPYFAGLSDEELQDIDRRMRSLAWSEATASTRWAIPPSTCTCSPPAT